MDVCETIQDLGGLSGIVAAFRPVHIRESENAAFSLLLIIIASGRSETISLYSSCLPVLRYPLTYCVVTKVYHSSYYNGWYISRAYF